LRNVEKAAQEGQVRMRNMLKGIRPI